ncbi:VOC family protein [Calidifontibacter sp. DB0510]|uniref:VOC family protein n=1 Tax=Metallococcus carri TaxID=1656884 RepID=A0A967EBT9_9MICO|nr:VOC family protein [Metallococcus carri]NHN57319.1 VOC family protein [Metallococcus carri]NOP38076.1 VOC family protein [Calidifontibacter sp. DB2511S]
MPTWIHLFLDVPAPQWQVATAFWSSVTGCRVSAPRGEHGQFVTLVPDDGPAWLKLQAVDDGPGGVHLDLDSTDRAAAIRRATALGARSVGRYHDVEVMRSPGGFTFCQTLAEGTPQLVRQSDSVLDQVCLDIPNPVWDKEIDFWQALTGRPLEQGRRPEFAFLGAEGALRILLQRLDGSDGPVRAHPDFAVADRPAQEQRHVDAGAELVERFEWWTVLRAPGGQVYCLTDRDPATGRVRRG